MFVVCRMSGIVGSAVRTAGRSSLEEEVGGVIRQRVCQTFVELLTLGVRGLGVVTQRVCELLRSVRLVVQVQNGKQASSSVFQRWKMLRVWLLSKKWAEGAEGWQEEKRK
jgi:hypothetical protein